MTVNRLLCFFAVSDITFEQFEFKNRVIAIPPSSLHVFNMYLRNVRRVKSLITCCTRGYHFWCRKVFEGVQNHVLNLIRKRNFGAEKYYEYAPKVGIRTI